MGCISRVTLSFILHRKYICCEAWTSSVRTSLGSTKSVEHDILSVPQMLKARFMPKKILLHSIPKETIWRLYWVDKNHEVRSQGSLDAVNVQCATS